MKANAIILIERISPLDGLKSYGKRMNLPKVNPGDLGFIEALSPLSVDGDKTHAFYPAKWNYGWMFKVSTDQFKFKES